MRKLGGLVIFITKLLWKVIWLFIKNINNIFGFVKSILGNIIERIKRLFRFSISFKITVVYAFIFTLLLLVSSMGILIGFKFFLIKQAEFDLNEDIEVVSNNIIDNSSIPKNEIENIAKRRNIVINILDDDNELIYSNKGFEDNLLQFNNNSLSNDILNKENLSLREEIILNNKTLHVEIIKDLSRENLYISVLFIALLITNSIAVIVTLLTGSKVSKRMLRPVEVMTKTVKDITVQNLDTRLDVKGSKDELKELAQTFNEMIDRIQSSYEKQKQFVSDASHELRTPISVIQGYANLLDRWGKDDKEVLEESIQAIKGESENMKDLVEKLLFLARNDNNLLKLEKEKFWINELIDEIVKETKLIDTKHEIISNINEKTSISGDRKLIKQALRIFVDNSVKYTPENGEIEISCSRKKKNIEITIRDTGIGIPKEDLPYIFDRFYRSDKSRTKKSGGNGLGLSIAKLIIDKHRGVVDVKSKVKVGTKVTIYLPIA
ncbi:hypothetical protein BET03_06620 [Thermohalobacter berrensis]|uniref:histidine kinase n=1 Tax=Thermohalobacter berrensis TaxID=99594 RepID=A0A419SV01_9FIRM|nr:hypothetical protein BET03_06620 [Thermohalobacter berrensis]